MGIKNSNNNQHLLRHQHQQISSFNPSCCLRPAAPTSSPFLDVAVLAANRRNSDADHDRHGPRGRRQDGGGKAGGGGPQSSPRIGCMGQIGRSGSYNGRSGGGGGGGNSKKLFQFRRMFSSGKSINAGTMMVSQRASAKVDDDSCCRQGTIIADTMDPPLPVSKDRGGVDRGDNVCSLWKRRRGGEHGLQSLEISQVKLMEVQNLRRNLGGLGGVGAQA